MDVLSDVMRVVRLNGAVYFDVRASEPVVAETPNMSQVGHQLMPEAAHVIPFHIMLRGKCWAESTEVDAAPIELEEGDIVFYPHGHGHAFVTNIGDRVPVDAGFFCRPDGRPLPIMRQLFDESPPSVRFVCGYLACDASPFNPLLEALPSQVVAPRPPEGNHIEVDLIHAAIAESQEQRAGGDTILARLSELLFVRVLRRYIEQLPEQSSGWLAGLRDPNINRALHLLHARPAEDWTLEALARECGMSRAIFADRFAKCIGETPMRYLAKWRMQLATHLLDHPGANIDTVAEQVGYQSVAAFNRAFKGIVGVPPGTWRRSRRAAEAALPHPG